MGFQTLSLIRHGKAEASHPQGDRYRPLSAEGVARITSMAPLARGKGFCPDLVVSSPYVRALQTRDLFVAEGLAERVISDEFSPDADPRDGFEELRVWESQGFSNVAVFSHNPLVSALAELLLAPSEGAPPEFHTPTILVIAFDTGLHLRAGRTLWVLHP